MRSLIVIALFVICPALALAQGGGGGGGSGGGGAAGGGAAGGSATGGATGGAAAPATPGVTSPTAPSTPSQQNLDVAPPTRSLPNAGGGGRVAPQPPGSPNTGTQTDTSTPPSSGGAGRQSGGANSSVQSRENRTGKNPLNETYTSCVRMWDAQTHMTRTEWQRACRRVENRLQTLKTR